MTKGRVAKDDVRKTEEAKSYQISYAMVRT